MKKSRYSEEQIIVVLKEHQAGIPVAELCREHGIGDATFYNVSGVPTSPSSTGFEGGQ